MMTLAGLQIEAAPNFWRRIASIHHGSIRSNHAASHLATPERFLALEQTALEIKGKLERGEPLIPEKQISHFGIFSVRIRDVKNERPFLTTYTLFQFHGEK